MRDSEETSARQKEIATKNLRQLEHFNAARADHAAATKSTPSQTVYRELYTSAKTDEVNKILLFKEGAFAAKMSDSDAKNVYQYFGDTYQFYNEVCHVVYAKFWSRNRVSRTVTPRQCLVLTLSSG